MVLLKDSLNVCLHSGLGAVFSHFIVLPCRPKVYLAELTAHLVARILHYVFSS